MSSLLLVHFGKVELPGVLKLGLEGVSVLSSSSCRCHRIPC